MEWNRDIIINLSAEISGSDELQAAILQVRSFRTWRTGRLLAGLRLIFTARNFRGADLASRSFYHPSPIGNASAIIISIINSLFERKRETN